MLKGRKIAVIVPAFNEEHKIAITLTTIPSWVDLVIAIDDSSQDKTLQVMRAISKEFSRVQVISMNQNSGVGRVTTTGYKYAITAGMDICCVMDGDGQMDPHYLESLVKPLLDGPVQMTKGNRFFSATSYRGMPVIRIIGNLIFTLLTRVGSGYWRLTDPQNGYVAVKCSTLDKIDLDALASGYSFQNDFICKLKPINARIQDIDIPAKYADEVSTLKIFPVGLEILRTLGRAFLTRIYFSPKEWTGVLLILEYSFSIIGLLFAIIRVSPLDPFNANWWAAKIFLTWSGILFAAGVFTDYWYSGRNHDSRR
jgi:glycosyltransferase involved in cell wall biosynthesis